MQYRFHTLCFDWEILEYFYSPLPLYLSHLGSLRLHIKADSSFCRFETSSCLNKEVTEYVLFLQRHQ